MIKRRELLVEFYQNGDELWQTTFVVRVLGRDICVWRGKYYILQLPF